MNLKIFKKINIELDTKLFLKLEKMTASLMIFLATSWAHVNHEPSLHIYSVRMRLSELKDSDWKNVTAITQRGISPGYQTKDKNHTCRQSTANDSYNLLACSWLSGSRLQLPVSSDGHVVLDRNRFVNTYDLIYSLFSYFLLGQ